MKSKLLTKRKKSEIETIVRKRNQITLPSEAVNFLGVREGDVIVIKLTDGSALLRPVRRSYAGIAKGVYGDAFVARERADWE
ncbi:MAG TPA: AbrB/MazE/SpoVT family DNA-binding domain-containing protein [Candidatus Babeliales bacterium]|nr:AbrB/MazE/SpoVT family DNA-binding domain-containing protein [Candidatus Babeliales bacterium]